MFKLYFVEVKSNLLVLFENLLLHCREDTPILCKESLQIKA